MRTIIVPSVAVLAFAYSMSADTPRMTDAKIVRTANVAADIETAWAAWTKRDELTKWFCRDANVGITPGGPYEILFLMDNPPGLQGGEGNKVQAVLPGRMLAFTWNAPPSFGPLRDERTHVVLELADHQSGGTTVTLTHYGWREGDEWAKVREYFENAWTRVMASLVRHLGEAAGANPTNDRKVDYVEFATSDLAKTKAFYSAAFGWKFTDYGPEYTSFNDGRLSGGFFNGGESAAQSALVIMYCADLEAAEKRVANAGGTITERHDFPGGRRFHFKDPNGITLAVWTDRRPDGAKIE